jgi:hypothetical protein
MSSENDLFEGSERYVQFIVKNKKHKGVFYIVVLFYFSGTRKLA